MIAHDFILPGWRRFVNVSGEAVPPGAILRVVSRTLDKGEEVLRCSKPDSTFRRLYFVNGPWEVPAASGSEGICSRLGESGLALVGSGTPSVGQVWGPKPSEWGLYQHYYGFEVLGSAETVGSRRLVLATQHRVESVVVKTQGTVNKDGTGTVDVRTTNVPSDSDTTWDIAGAYNKANRITGTKYATVWFPGHTPLLMPYECG